MRDSMLRHVRRNTEGFTPSLPATHIGRWCFQRPTPSLPPRFLQSGSVCSPSVPTVRLLRIVGLRRTVCLCLLGLWVGISAHLQLLECGVERSTLYLPGARVHKALQWLLRGGVLPVRAIVVPQRHGVLGEARFKLPGALQQYLCAKRLLGWPTLDRDAAHFPLVGDLHKGAGALLQLLDRPAHFTNDRSNIFFRNVNRGRLSLRLRRRLECRLSVPTTVRLLPISPSSTSISATHATRLHQHLCDMGVNGQHDALCAHVDIFFALGQLRRCARHDDLAQIRLARLAFLGDLHARTRQLFDLFDEAPALANHLAYAVIWHLHHFGGSNFPAKVMSFRGRFATKVTEHAFSILRESTHGSHHAHAAHRCSLPPACTFAR
eukprot:m.1634989 g.1634989  ORF g.1634989 m.1634989 type:complete len:378 (-) comp25418_c2_seq2:647-1780(-)